MNPKTSENKIYTHDKAAQFIDIIEQVLIDDDIHVPSPEDDERDEDDQLGFYGSVYSDMLDEIENNLIEILEKAKNGVEVVSNEYSNDDLDETPAERNKIYTHDHASEIIDVIEQVLIDDNIHVPSPEDDERDEDDQLGFYGSVYSDLLDEIENDLIEIISSVKNGAEIVPYEFSGDE